MDIIKKKLKNTYVKFLEIKVKIELIHYESSNFIRFFNFFFIINGLNIHNKNYSFKKYIFICIILLLLCIYMFIIEIIHQVQLLGTDIIGYTYANVNILYD
jgi:hypothetical protein